MNEKILVVDDNDMNRMMLADVLGQWGYEVAEVNHGKAVFGKIDEFVPDLILLDVMLPGMNGFEICQRLRKDRRCERTPIVMVTALDDADSRAQGISVGADMFVSRPFDYTEMRRNIESLIAKSRSYRATENIESVCDFVERLLEQAVPDKRAHWSRVYGYAKRTGRILGLDSSDLLTMRAGCLMLGLEDAFDMPRGGQGSLPVIAKIAEPLSIASWLGDLVSARAAGNPYGCADVAAQTVALCADFAARVAAGASDKAALADIKRDVAVKHTEALGAFEALEQAVNDESFLRGLMANQA